MRVDFTDHKPGRAWNRTPASKEAQILRARADLRKNSVLGEYGALADAWVMRQRRTTSTIEALLTRWRAEGLPDYVQFDNDNVCQGAHHYPDAVGRVSRLCLGVISVFAPPREPGLQNAIEGFNGLWQSRISMQWSSTKSH